MPMPIRPVNQTDSIFPAAMGDERGMGLFGLQNSPMQLMMKEELERRENKKVVAERKGGIDSRDVELIHRLWMEQEEGGPVMATAEARGRVSMQVPNSTSSYDLMRLKTNGLAIGSGNVITLTKRGEKLLKDKILATPSSFWLNRSKDGFDMRAAEPRRSRLVRLSQAPDIADFDYEEALSQLESEFNAEQAKIQEALNDPNLPPEAKEQMQEQLEMIKSSYEQRKAGLDSMRPQADAARAYRDQQRAPRVQYDNIGSNSPYVGGTSGGSSSSTTQSGGGGIDQGFHGLASSRRKVRTAQVRENLTTPPGYGNVFDPDPARRPQIQEPLDPWGGTRDDMKPNPPGFWDWYRKELQPGRGKDVDARDQFVRQHASGWLNPFFRPWAAKEYYDKAIQYRPNDYPYLPSEKELDTDNMYQQLMRDNDRRMQQERDRNVMDTIRGLQSQAPQAGSWGQTVMAANEAARMALAQEADESGSNSCPDCQGSGIYPGGYRKRTQKCFTCGGTGKVQ